MKVRNLYIIGDEYVKDREVKKVCNGLFTKYRPRCQTISMGACNAPSLVKNKEKGFLQNGFSHDVGVYVVFHAMGAGIDANTRMTPFQFVEMLQRTLGDDDFKNMGRIVMLACSISYLKPILNHAAGKTLDEIAEFGDGAGYLLLVLHRLATLGVRPKLIGWDCFVSALPHKPRKQDVFSHTEEPAAAQKLTDEQIKKLAGAKVVQGQSGAMAYGRVTPAYREEHKRTYWVENGKVTILGSEGWSDK